MTSTDTQALWQHLHGTAGELPAELRGFFDPNRPVSLARAPGRLDVMGGIADYSGSLVLQWPIREAAVVAAQRTDHTDWEIVSLSAGPPLPPRRVRLSGDEVAKMNDYAAARMWFQQDEAHRWSAYLAGVLLVLRGEMAADVASGWRLLVRSHVPEGKGVSSSAALEVATMRAVCDQLGITVDGAEAARLCQIAENRVVGAPCGIMDQMTSALGQDHQLLALLCQPAQVQGFVTVPDSIGFWGIDSGIRHAVSGSDYTSVRTGAFMGYRMIAALQGLPAEANPNQPVLRIDDAQWQGYLANITPETFDQEFAGRLPETISGAVFLREYGGTTDAVTCVEPEKEYAVRQPTAHPVREHMRVQRFRELLLGAIDERACMEMGELMFASHASYSACGLGSPGTDRLVEMVRAAGPAAGLFGAKITGGGSGGTVAVLGDKTAGAAVERIARDYAAESGHEAYIFRGSSSGAWHEDVLVARV